MYVFTHSLSGLWSRQLPSCQWSSVMDPSEFVETTSLRPTRQPSWTPILCHLVELSDGRTTRRHVDQLRSRTAAPAGVADLRSDEDDMMPSPHIEATAAGPQDTVPSLEPPTGPRRSDRVRRQPDCFV